MTETTADGGPESVSQPLSQPLFIRPRSGRILAGVCAGIAERWHLDVTLVRLLTAVLGLISGLGVVAYLAAWLLTPSADGPAPLHPDAPFARALSTRGPSLLRRGLAVILVLVLAAGLIGLLHRLLWWNGAWGWGWGPGWVGLGIGVPIAAIAVVAAIGILFGSRIGRVLAAAAVLLVVLATTVIAVFGSSFGSRSFSVASVRDMQGTYDYPVGTVHLDLSGLGSVTGRHTTAIRMGSGDVTVSAPPGVPVLVRGRAGVGSVTIDGHRTSGLDTAQTARLAGADPTGSDELIVNVSVGVGSVTVT